MKELITFVEKQHKKGKTVGLCHGCFDVIHFGHVQHFEYAKSKCDNLVVSITSSRFIEKGVNRPFFSDDARKGVLDAISVIDFVYINEEATAESILARMSFDYYFKGRDYKDMNDPRVKREVFAMNSNTKLIITPTPKLSSTDVLNAKLIG